MSNAERKFSKQADPHAWRPRIKTDPSAEFAHMMNPSEVQNQSTSGEYTGMKRWEMIALGAVATAGLVVGAYRLAHTGKDRPAPQPHDESPQVQTTATVPGRTHTARVETSSGPMTMSFELPPTETAGPALPPPPEQYAPGEQPSVEH